MGKNLNFRDLGLIDYLKAWKYQEELLDDLVNRKLKRRKKDDIIEETEAGTLLFCEHPHVYTLGKSGSENNLLVGEKQLRDRGASFYRIDRGGDITYHGPGQIVGYPIIDLEILGIGVKKYIALLEDAVILTLKEFNISASRLEKATGVWLDHDQPGRSRKICAIGVRVSRAVTMHGFAFNVNTNLDYFKFINPCGFVDKGVTSLAKELGHSIPPDEVKEILKQKISSVFGTRIIEY